MLNVASHADVLRGSSRVSTPLTWFVEQERVTSDEPPRTSAWESVAKAATYILHGMVSGT